MTKFGNKGNSEEKAGSNNEKSLNSAKLEADYHINF